MNGLKRVLAALAVLVLTLVLVDVARAEHGGVHVRVEVTADPMETWCGVRVAPETECPSYDSDDWSYPDDLDVRYGLRAASASLQPDKWWSPYDGRLYRSYRDLDIEHLRSRHSAAKGGGCDWPAEMKRGYAKDPMNVTVAPPDVNRHQKSDKDPDRWMPERNRHWFAWRYVLVSRNWGLTITPESRAVLDEALGGRCP